MLSDEIRKLKTGQRELRKFGLSVGAVLLLLGMWFSYRHRAQAVWFLGAGSVLLVLGLSVPRGLKQVFIGWMTLAFLLGFIVSNVLLTLFFYLMVTPTALAARCLGKDFLQRRWDNQANSYWQERDSAKPHSPPDYERQVLLVPVIFAVRPCVSPCFRYTATHQKPHS